jgi:YD repeat-containing protein
MPLGTHADGVLAAAVVLFLFAPQSANARTGGSRPRQQGAASAGTTSHGEVPVLSDREKAGLRGPVEECILETITPPGPTSHAWRMVYTTKYDPDGRMYQLNYVNNDGSKGMESLTYDTKGHLLRVVWDTQGGTRDTIYSYDAQGRLIGITGEPYRNTVFEYDDQGHKTRIIKSELKAPSSSARNQGSGIQIEGDDLIAFPPPGGLVKTLFNERDQPIESQVYAASGDLTSRLTRAYDAKGRVADSSYVIEDFGILLPPEGRERLAADPAASEEMKTQFLKLLGDRRSLIRISYIYDDEGRVIEKHERTGVARERITKIIYNDHGDKMQEIATASGALNPPKNKQSEVSPGSPERPDLLDERSDVRFDYKYDTFGNWVEQTVSSTSGENESPRTSTHSHRTITYY